MIRLESVSRQFIVGDQTVHALDKASIDIKRGEYVAIMGPSGSGKSTLLHVIGLLDRPDSGSYYFNEMDTTKFSEVRLAQIRSEDIGFVFQFFHLVPRLSALENVELPMTLAGVEADERSKRANAALAAVSLSDRSTHKPDQLSGGQRQRVAIARATVMQPGVVLADEPTGNLDQASGHEVIEVLESLNRSGLTLLLVTHDRELAKRARRVIQLVDGQIVEDIRQD